MSSGPGTFTQVPLACVLAVVGVGLLVVALADWEAGCVVISLGLLLGAGLRLSLPARTAGALVVRGRVLDATLLLVAGLGVLALALNVPGG
jgi:hypothetical protein